jgi:hypothetical protein
MLQYGISDPEKGRVGADGDWERYPYNLIMKRTTN